MKKNIWIMNHYAGGMLFDRGGRHYNFAKNLKQVGYEPVVFCCNAKHDSRAEIFFDMDTLWREEIAEELQVPFVYVQSRAYAGNGKQRILNMIDFYRNVKKAAREYAGKYGKPDVILASSVHPLTIVAGIQLAKHFGVKCIGEVRDLWPESIVEYSSRLTKKNPLIKLLYQGEKWIYKQTAAMIFTMEGAYDYIVEQGWESEIPREKVFHINNGVDLEKFDANREQFIVQDEDLDHPDLFNVVYTGSIRRVNNLGMLLDAAKLIKDSRIRLLIWGAGDELEALKQRVEDEHIENVVFKGRVDKKYVPGIVSRSDLNVVHWEMANLLRFGVSYNKLFEYLAAGRPIFSTVRPGYSLIERFCCGADTAGFTPQDFADGIQALAQRTETERAEMGRNARQVALNYDFKSLTDQLIQIIER